MNKENDIMDKLIKMLVEKYNVKISEKLTRDDIINMNLLGQNARLKSIDLMCLFLDVEKEFNVKISEEHILAGRFKTLKGIQEAIINS